MRNSIVLNIPLLALLVLVSCTSARWTVKDKAAADPSDYEVLQRQQFLQAKGRVSPDNPTLHFNVLSRTEYQYSQKVLVQRNIQDYRLRPGFLALGLTGSALAFYAANSGGMNPPLSSAKSISLNAAGGLLALSGFLNMKPVGNPRPTGEERFLRKTGEEIKVDTVNVSGSVQQHADISITHEGSVVIEDDSREITSGGFDLNLAGELSRLQLKGENPGVVGIQVTFNDSTYRYEYPVASILQPYAEVTSQLTELRNSPQDIPDNILADLLQGSQVKIQDLKVNQWFRVLYGGISDNYILQEDADIIWRSFDFNSDEQVVTVPQIPFGDVDVESNIPILRGETSNAVALILTNENYSKGYPQRNYAHRDGRLISTYLKNALGYQDNNIYELSDVSSSNEVYRKLSQLRFATNDSTELFIYLSSYGEVTRNGNRMQLKLLNVANEDNADSDLSLDLQDFLEQVSSLPAGKTVVVGDIDFSRRISERTLSTSEEQQLLQSYAEELENRDKQTSLLLGMQLSQPSGIYVSTKGEDKKHRIFPYYFAKALQNRRTALSSIYQYLEQNVSYTSRRLHDRSQDPMLLGDVFLDLVAKGRARGLNRQ